MSVEKTMDSGPGPHSTDVDDIGRMLPAGLGFFSLCAQTILLRELFSVLEGSDLAFAFALASWTCLTALGAVIGQSARLAAPWARRIGLPVYIAGVSALFLVLRGWGAEEVVPFYRYCLVPVYLALPCVVGGMLFPLFLAGKPPVPPRVGYAAEVLGCLAGSLFCALYFRLGGLPLPLLISLLCLSAILFGPWARYFPLRTMFMPVLAVGLLLPLLPGMSGLERLSLKLHFRRGTVLAAKATAHASMVAVRDDENRILVVENGLPWPDPEGARRQREALLAVMMSLPKRLRGLVLIHGRRQGLGPAVASMGTEAACTFLESDRAALAFARTYLGERRCSPSTRIAYGIRPGQVPRNTDLVVVASPPPSGLHINRLLCVEFFRAVRSRLAPGGVLAVALPAAPGFTHPERGRYQRTVEAALREAFGACRTLRTQIGWQIYAAGKEGVEPSAAAERLPRRCPGAAKMPWPRRNSS